ncbi:hypothetical protein DPMN_109175 [Dreissena polymorpha]|uniref:Uncharacterized protein n=1 Tax=Dreissena polymorpha TaxID=45954 RepID=A0A9D4KAL9_DREPO|nr:hypothetical protein DPMN_109175 [Dreissena polymorpha]
MDNIKGQFEITDAGQLAYSADGWNVEKADEAFAFYTFYKIYGTIYLRMGTKENNKDKLNIALVKFGKAMDIIHSERSKKLKKVFKSDIAIIQNLHGCVYFSIGDLTNALECHKSAKVSDCTRPSFVSQRFEFAANIAACYQQMGLNTKIENDRMKHLSYALKEYDNCIGLNKQIGMQHSTTSLTILRNRADVFYVKGELERALTDGNNVLNIARQLYVSPHVDITVAIERAACYHFKLGKRLRDEDGEIGTDLMQKGLQLYEDMLFEICNGGLLPFENNDDRVIFSELEELIKNRHDPAQPNIDRSVYIEALDHIKNGDSSMCDGPNRIAYQHLIEWLRNRRMQLRTNKQYRNAKDNHIKLMEKLGLSKKAIEKTKHKYQQDFELGKFNKLINKKQSYVPDYEEQERVRQAIAAGAEIILDPNQKDMHQIERAFGGIDCCLDSGSFDNHDQDPSTSDNKEDRDIEHMLVGKRRDLRRQRSIDGSSDVLNSIVAEGEVKLRNLSTSKSSRSSLGSLKRKSSSVSSSGSFTEPWLKTSSFSSQTSQGESSFDNDIIEYDEDELRARDCDQKRQSWANAGKQESISSELSKLQVLDDEFEPVPKQLKVEETDDK